MELWGMASKLKMVTLNHIKHNPTASYILPLIQKKRGVQTCITDDNTVDEVVD